MTDEHLMALIKSGDLDLLEVLYERYGKKLFNYFLKSTLSKADSDDLTQELFIRVMKYRKSYKEGQKVQFWIFQIARNMIKDHFSKMKVRNNPLEWVDNLPEMASEESDQMEKEQKLYQAMSELSEEKRELLVLSKFEGMKYDQVAELKGLTVANVKVQVHRTLKELRQHYFRLND